MDGSNLNQVPAVLTGVFCGFPQSLTANTRIKYHNFGHNDIFPKPLQLTLRSIANGSITIRFVIQANFQVLARKQKLFLSDSSWVLCSLRSQISQLAALEDTAIILPKQSVLQSWLVSYRTINP
jgi:hypothetical protein